MYTGVPETMNRLRSEFGIKIGSSTGYTKEIMLKLKVPPPPLTPPSESSSERGQKIGAPFLGYINVSNMKRLLTTFPLFSPVFSPFSLLFRKSGLEVIQCIKLLNCLLWGICPFCLGQGGAMPHIFPPTLPTLMVRVARFKRLPRATSRITT